MNRFSYLLCGVMLLSFFACSSEKSASATVENAKKKAATAVKKSNKNAEKNACDYISADMIATALEVSKEVINEKGFEYSACTFTWEKPNQAEIDKRNEALMAEYSTKMMEALKKGEKLKRPKMEESIVRIVLASRGFKSADLASRAFDSLTKAPKEVSAEKDGQKFSYKIVYDHQVEGIGDKAAWSDKMNQLSFLLGDTMLHLTVDKSLDDAENLASATALAKMIIAKN